MATSVTTAGTVGTVGAPASDTGLPAALRRELDDAIRSRWAPDPAAFPIFLDLLAANAAGWQLEDDVRTQPDDARLRELKVSIDANNIERSRAIAKLDVVVHSSDERTNSPTEVAVVTTSIGAALDRLTVTLLRIEALVRRADPCVGQVHAQFRDLMDAVDADLADVRAGRRRLPVPGLFKAYGDAPVTATGT